MTREFPDLTGRTILVVEDHDDALEMLEAAFRSCRARVVAARNPIAALDYLQTITVDLIVSDLSMPEMDGIQFIERVRQSQHHRHIPAIALTAYAEEYSGARLAGYDVFMRKPTDIDKLCAKVAELLPPRRRSTGSDA